MPLGRQRFATETGIKESDWYGRFWATWGEAVREAGYAPNAWNAAHGEEHLLTSYARLIRELCRLPREAEIRMKCLADSSFPSHNSFARFGGKPQLLASLRKFCETRSDFGDVLEIIGPPAPRAASGVARTRHAAPLGFVYLIRFGRHYKIGRTNAVGRRERELAIQLPDKARTVHIIQTDDPEGIDRMSDQRPQNRATARPCRLLGVPMPNSRRITRPKLN